MALENRPPAALNGLGALGILYGEKLLQGLGADRLRVIAGAERAARYRQQGVLCNGRRCEFSYTAPGEATGPADLVIFAVKATGLAEAIRDAKNQVGPNTVLLSVLNGITSERELAAAFGPEKVLYSVAQGMDAVRRGTALTYTHAGTLALGEADGAIAARLKAVAALLEGCGIACQLRGDILRHQWSKLMLNVGVNQATAVYGTDYSGVQAPGPARQAMLAAMEEARAVAAAKGVSLTERDVEGWLELLATFDPRGMPSMRQDVLARRPTEVELFAGTITRLGRETGVPTPVNDRFLQEIRAMEAGWSR